LHGGSPELTKLVLEHTADYGVDSKANRKRKDGKTLPTVFDLLSHQNFHGCTAMHFCADGGCTQGIIDLILDACQDYCTCKRAQERRKQHPICIQDEDGDTPIHFACSAGLGPDTLRRFVMQPDSTVVFSSLATKSYNGRLPIDDLIVWALDEHGLEGNADDPPLEERMPAFVADALWLRVEVLMQGVVNGFSEDYQETTPFHWAARIQTFPAVVLRLACKRCGDQNSEGLLALDKKGMSLLHHAVNPICRNDLDSSVYELGSGEYLELSRWRSKGEQRSPIEYLLELCPAALWITSKNGELPIHMAISGSKTTVEEILAMIDAAPETLAHRDAQGLLPFMIAASTCKGYGVHLDKAFKLLQLNPELIRNTSVE
jgi:ankyrin repeat protein